jgi:hypothetical protein
MLNFNSNSNGSNNNNNMTNSNNNNSSNNSMASIVGNDNNNNNNNNNNSEYDKNKLPENWVAEKSYEGKTFYYNVVTHENQWEFPTRESIAMNQRKRKEEEEMEAIYEKEEKEKREYERKKAKEREKERERERERENEKEREWKNDSEKRKYSDSINNYKEKRVKFVDNLPKHSSSANSSSNTSKQISHANQSLTEEEKTEKLKNLRQEISAIVIGQLSKYEIKSNHERFKHYARKITHMIMEKESKSANISDEVSKIMKKKIKVFTIQYIEKHKLK